MEGLRLFLAVLSATCLPCSAVNPGLKLRLSQPGLQYGAQQATRVLSAKVLGKTIPNQSGEAHTPVGKVHYDLTNMVVTSFTAPTSQVTVQPPQTVTLSIVNVGASIHGDWKYDYKKLIHIRDHGSFDVTVSGASITLGIALGIDSTSSGRPTIKTTSCTSNVASVKVKFHGGASWLYNLFDGSASKAIKSNLQSTLCKSAADAINVDGAQALAGMKVQVHITDTTVLDYRLVVAPGFGAGFVETSHKGEVFWKGDSTEAPITPAPFPEPPQTTRMVSIWMSDYMLNTAGRVFHNHGLLTYNLTSKDLPDKDKNLLNTSCSGVECLVNFLPQVRKLYPNCFMELGMGSTAAPVLDIATSLLQARFSGQIDFYAILKNNTKAFLLSMLINVNMSLSATIDGDKIKASVTSISPKLAVKQSAIGEVPEAFLNSAFQLAVNLFIKPKLNEVGQRGIELPSVDGLTYVNPDVKLTQDAVCFSTDLQYNPSR